MPGSQAEMVQAAVPQAQGTAVTCLASPSGILSAQDVIGESAPAVARLGLALSVAGLYIVNRQSG